MSGNPPAERLTARHRLHRLGGGTTAAEARRLGVTLGGYAGRFGLTFGASILIARWLGPAGYGAIALVAAAFAIVDTIGDAGLTYAAIRAVSRALSIDQDNARRLARAYLGLGLAGNALAALGGVALAGPIAQALLGRPDLEPYLRLAFLGLVPAAISGYVAVVIQSMQEFGRLARLQIVSSAGYLAGVLLLATFGQLSVASIVLLGAVTPLLAVAYGARRLPAGWLGPTGLLSRPVRTAWRELFGFSRWLWISAILSLLAAQLDLLLVGHWAGAATVGLYALAFNLSLRLDVLNQARFTVLLPAVSTLRTPGDVHRYIRRNVAWGAGLSLPCLAGALLARPLIELFYGADFVEAAPIFQVLLVGVIFDLITAPLVLLAFPFEAPKVLAASDGIRVAVLFALSAVLIPVAGPLGAAAAKLAAKLAGTIFALVILSRRRPVGWAGGPERPPVAERRDPK